MLRMILIIFFFYIYRKEEDPVINMPYKDDYMMMGSKQRHDNLIFWVFFGILAFIAVYVPFFGPNLRYQTGTMLAKIFTTAGTILVSLGVLMFVWGLFTLFCGSRTGGVKIMILGFLLAFIGGYLLNPALIGASGTGKDIPRGYH